MFIFSSENWKDIENYYFKTVVKFTETGDRLWRINSVSPHDVICVDVDGLELSIDLDYPYTVEYVVPGRVVYQQGNTAMLLSRRPQKMYKRGISEENTQLMYLPNTGGWKSAQLTLGNLQQFVDKPAYQDVSTIDWESGYLSWALDKHFAVCQDGTLMCLFKSIGVVDYKTKTVKLKFKLFKQEVASLFNNWTIV